MIICLLLIVFSGYLTDSVNVVGIFGVAVAGT